MAYPYKVHRIVEGPYEEEGLVWLLCLAEYTDGEIGHIEMYTETVAEAICIKDTFNKTIEPLILLKENTGVTVQ